MNSIGIGERSPWRNFPKVIRNGDLGALAKEPEYAAAKAGDARAALDMVDRLLTEEIVLAIRTLIGSEKPRLLPVLATESGGNNKLPLAMAEVLADRLGLDVELGIVQREKIFRTGTGSDYRLAFNPSFQGSIVNGQKYLILDDTLAMGGTLASLRGFVENRGGVVIGASVMVAHEGALDLAVKPGMLAAINQKHGAAMNTYWKETFGYGIDCLTQGEAGHLKSAESVDAIRTRIAAARHAGVEQLDARRTQETPTGKREQGIELEPGVEANSSSLRQSAEGMERAQQELLEMASVEQTYQNTLSVYVQAKHDQVEAMEDRLERLIAVQQERLAQSQVSQPGVFSLPSTIRKWQEQTTQREVRLHTLHQRMEVVREIKECMGLQCTRVEELATRKMRAENPAIASCWDAMRTSVREQELQSHSEKKSQSRLGVGRSLSQS